MKYLERIAISIVSMLLLAGYKHAECDKTVVDFPNASTTHNIDVELTWNAALDECIASKPKPNQANYEIRTSKMGDTINWQILNNCPTDMTIGISSLRPTRKDNRGVYEVVDHPLESASDGLRATALKGGPQVVITAKTKAGISHHGRKCATSYVYDIEQINSDGTRRVIHDPQIEVPR